MASEGTGRPRRCAIHTPSGPIDAATMTATVILRGVLGMIIALSRMMMVIQVA